MVQPQTLICYKTLVTKLKPRPAAVITNGLTKRYGRQLAVDRLSIEVPAGVVAGFIGPNGAGKTTTMAMLLGLVRPTGGTGTASLVHSTRSARQLDCVSIVSSMGKSRLDRSRSIRAPRIGPRRAGSIGLNAYRGRTTCFPVHAVR
jgi:ABC-type glutathione transport system ATPase component